MTQMVGTPLAASQYGILATPFPTRWPASKLHQSGFGPLGRIPSYNPLSNVSGHDAQSDGELAESLDTPKY